MSAPSLNETDYPAFLLKSQDDALNFARHSVERAHNWLSSHSLDWPERYGG